MRLFKKAADYCLICGRRVSKGIEVCKRCVKRIEKNGTSDWEEFYLIMEQKRRDGNDNTA